MDCIVHYSNLKSCGKTKKLTEINIEKINLAKEKRQQVDGVHYHSQVDNIPVEIDLEKHGIHLEPCLVDAKLDPTSLYYNLFMKFVYHKCSCWYFDYQSYAFLYHVQT